MSEPSWIIYGATGYTGRAIAEEAARRGLRPILAGRNASSIPELARTLGLEVWTWTVNGPADFARVLDLGIDAVTTDRPEHALNYLATGDWSA